MSAYIFDTETTGVTSKKPDAVLPNIVEAAWLKMSDDFTSLRANGFQDLNLTDEYLEQFKPNQPISLGAMATHHIIDSDLVHARPCDEFKLPEDMTYMIGHNVDFDWEVSGQPNVKRICTLAISRALLPELDSHQQSSLVYHFSQNQNDARDMVKNAHNALADIKSCAFVLGNLMNLFEKKFDMEIKDLDHLWRISEKARIPTVMPFGKHQGINIAELPQDYVQWALKQDGFDPYLMQAFHKNFPHLLPQTSKPRM